MLWSQMWPERLKIWESVFLMTSLRFEFDISIIKLLESMHSIPQLGIRIIKITTLFCCRWNWLCPTSAKKAIMDASLSSFLSTFLLFSWQLEALSIFSRWDDRWSHFQWKELCRLDIVEVVPYSVLRCLCIGTSCGFKTFSLWQVEQAEVSGTGTVLLDIFLFHTPQAWHCWKQCRGPSGPAGSGSVIICMDPDPDVMKKK